MKWRAEDRQHVHAGERLTLKQHCNVVAVHLEATSSLRAAIALVWCGVCSSIEAKPKNSPSRLVDDDFLVVLVDGGDPDPAGNHDVRLAARITHLVNALPGREIFEFHLARQYGHLFFAEERKEWNVFQQVQDRMPLKIPDSVKSGPA